MGKLVSLGNLAGIDHKAPERPTLPAINELSAEAIGRALGGKKIGRNWRCKCPAHDDKTPSLDITEKDGKIVFICRSGCTQEAVIAALRPMGLWHEATPEQREQAALKAKGELVQRAQTLANVLEGDIEAGFALDAQDLATLEQARDLIKDIRDIATTYGVKTGAPQRPPSSSSALAFSFAALQDTPPDPPETFWQDATLFRGSRVLLAGGAKMGKSDFFLGMAIAAATGGDFLGEPFARPLRVLWLQAEIHQAFIMPRLARHAVPSDSMALLRSNFFLTPRLNIKLDSLIGRANIKALLEDIQPDILGLDPFINFYGVNENDNKEVHAALTILDSLGDSWASVILHHTGKNPDAKGFDAIRGASAFRGWYDSGLLIQGDPKSLAYELRNAKSPQAHGLQFVDGTWQKTFQEPKDEPRGRPRVARNDDLCGTILELLRASGGAMSAGELTHAVERVSGAKFRTIQRQLSDLSHSGILETEGATRSLIYKISES